jgi:hypothetical protein
MNLEKHKVGRKNLTSWTDILNEDLSNNPVWFPNSWLQVIPQPISSDGHTIANKDIEDIAGILVGMKEMDESTSDPLDNEVRVKRSRRPRDYFTPGERFEAETLSTKRRRS